MDDFIKTWDKFKEILKIYPNLVKDLNNGSDNDNITQLEKFLNIELPKEMKILYLQNNGQKKFKYAVFKAVSGFSKYTKPKFLSLEEISKLWQKLKIDKIDVFSHNLIPFAADKFSDDIYCCDAFTNEVFLLWASAPDWTLPAEWQTAKIKRADNLTDFIENQIKLY